MLEITAAAVIPIGGKTNKHGSTGNAENKNAPQRRALAIGDEEFLRRLGANLPWEATISLSPFGDLNAELLLALGPHCVLTPLFGDGFDCLDVAQALSDLRYSGSLRILSPHIPKPAMVLLETRNLCPGIDVDLVFQDD